MPLSKQPLEVSLGGAVEEGNVKELVQPPRIREAKDCASLKGGAYTKRDQILTPGAVDPTTQGASHTDDALVTVASDNTVRVYPDDGTDPSESNPAPFTVSRLEAFEPTEADAVKSHGDSATHIVDGVPRTLSMWNTDFDGAYVAASCENNLGSATDLAPRWTGKDVGAPSIFIAPDSNGTENAWWTYLATNGVRFAVFDDDRQVGSEKDYPAPPRIEPPSGQAGADICALGKPTAPRVRAFEAPAAVGDPTQFFVSCAALTTPQKCRMDDPESFDPPANWQNSVYGSRLSTLCTQIPSRPYVGGMPPVPTSTRDIMERNGFALGSLYPANEGAYDDPDPAQVNRRQGPGMVLSLHDLDGNILESVRGDLGMVRPAVPDPATNPNANLMLPGPPLEMVVVDVDGIPFAYTLHVDYAQRFPYQGYPDPVAGYATGPYPAPGTDHPDRNTIRIIRWALLPNNPAGSRIQFVNEVYFNDPNWVNPATGPADGVVWENQVPDWAGAPADEGMRDWPAGLHDVGNQQLMLVFSSTRIALVPYNLDPATTTYKPPFWENGYLTRLKIGRMTGDTGIENPVWGEPDTAETPIAPEYDGLHYDMFERHCTGWFVTGDPLDPRRWNRQTSQMARGAWAGSFLSGPDQDGRWWLGVQTITDTDNVESWLLPGFPFGAGGGAPGGIHPYQYLWGPQTYSGSVVHTLLDESFDALDQESSCIPGCTIASQGLYAVTPNWSGHSVALYASAPGDDRTGQQEIGALTRSDVFSSTAFLAVRRNLRRPTGEVATQQGQQRLAPLDRQGNQYPASSAYVTAVAIVQALPFGQALDTYQANPYQCRVNLRQDGDRLIRWTAFQRYATTESFGSGDIDKDLRSLKVTGSSSRSAPYEMTYLPSPDGPRISPQMIPQHGYVTIAGGAPTVVGGPQGFLAGIALQAVVDNFVAYAVPTASFYAYQHRPINEAIPLPDYTAATLDQVADVEFPVPTALNVGSFLTVFDEQGGQHRTVPHTTSLGYAYTYNNVGWPDLDSVAMEAILYGVPWQLAGISLADEASVEVAVGRADEGDVPLSVAVPSPPFVTHEHQLVSGSATAAEQAVVVAPSGVSNTVPLDYRSTFGAGSGGALYTWSGELGADAPDPSRSVAAASNRLWSISSVDPRKAQYTKLLRKGYAPEWNQNLTVRVPGTADPLTAVAALPDGRILLFSSTAIHYTYGSGPSDTGQGAGFAEPAYLSTDIGCTDPRSIVTGDFGCIFLSERGFYLIDRKLTVSFVGLPYEDTTDIAGLRLKGTASDALRSEVLFFTDRIEEDTTGYQTWVFNTLRGQWSTFVMPEALSVTERDGRPFWITQSGTLRARFDEEPATIDGSQGVMSLTTGWLPMAKVQGYGRTWELQITGERPLTAAGYSQSGLKVELLYDYDETPAETYFFNQPAEAGGANIKLRLRPRKQKSEALSVRFSEYAPPGIPPDQPFTGWRLDMLTVLVGIKVGLDKVPTTPRDNT